MIGFSRETKGKRYTFCHENSGKMDKKIFVGTLKCYGQGLLGQGCKIADSHFIFLRDSSSRVPTCYHCDSRSHYASACTPKTTNTHNQILSSHNPNDPDGKQTQQQWIITDNPILTPTNLTETPHPSASDTTTHATVNKPPCNFQHNMHQMPQRPSCSRLPRNNWFHFSSLTLLYYRKK